MKKDEVLNKAKEIINGPRKKEYGDPTINFQRIADIWSIILDTNVTASQVAQCMIGLKLTRLIEDETNIDSYLDICGYSAIGCEVSEIKQDNDGMIAIKGSISHWRSLDINE